MKPLKKWVWGGGIPERRRRRRRSMSGQYSPSGMELPDETRLPRHSSLLLKPPATTRQDAMRCYFTHMSHYIIIIVTGGRAFEFQAVDFVTRWLYA